MPVKRSHMVSKGYLRLWGDARDPVEVLDLELGLGFVSSIQNATVVSYAYDPDVGSRDLEGQFDRIESAGISAMRKLRHQQNLTMSERKHVVAFLDMHLDRGRYADHTQIRVAAVLLKTDGDVENAALNLADRMILSQSKSDAVRLAVLKPEERPWAVASTENLATGDGAVLLWETTSGAGISTITFPLSLTQLLAIGKPFTIAASLNELLERAAAGSSARLGRST
jgi:hypothetical protein